ncbi:MAG: putative membrane protein YgcG [Saprospiraceae bacterium]|jgi:uncharacterized membrane protein YgcG
MKNLLSFNFLLFSFLFVSITLSSQDFTISNYDIELDINTDGSLNVEETIDLNFSKKKRGIYRSIPYEYSKDGESIKLGITDIKVDGYKYKISRKNGAIEIKIGDKNIFLEGNQTYRISYKIENGIQDYAEHQELYYDLIGSEWKAEIAKLNYQINLPRNIGISLNDLKATSGYKNQNNSGLSIKQTNPTTIQGTTTRKLKKGEGATIAIKLPKTYLSVAELASNGYRQELIKEEKDRVPQNPWLALIPVGFFAFFIDIWRRLFGGKYKPTDQETYSYPPEGLTSAHVGAYIDQSANTRDIVSLIPYWASEGFLEMKNIGDDTLLTKLKELPEEYPSYEHLIYNELFKNGDLKSMSSLKEKFYITLHKAKSDLSKEVHGQGYYKEEFIYWFRTWRLIIFPLAMTTLGVISMVAFSQTPIGIAFIAIGLAGLFFGLGKLPLSDHGKEVKYKLDGLKIFLEDVPESEIESIIKDDPKYFEKMLPFAVAFGIEKGFIPKFENTMQYMPLWYTTVGGTRSFSSFQSGFSTETISSAFSTIPQAAGGSSSGGGFSSGGGMGGGGGGSW